MPDSSLATIFTVGHSTRSLDELVAILDDADSWPLVDVRTYPGSKRHPQFNRANLEAELGDRYVHIPELGGRRRSTRTDSPNAGIYRWRGDLLMAVRPDGTWAPVATWDLFLDKEKTPA